MLFVSEQISTLFLPCCEIENLIYHEIKAHLRRLRANARVFKPGLWVEFACRLM